MTGAAMGFMITVWAIILIAAVVTIRPLLKSDK